MAEQTNAPPAPPAPVTPPVTGTGVQGAPPAPNAPPGAPPAPPAPPAPAVVPLVAAPTPEAFQAAEVALQTEKDKLAEIDKYLADGTKARTAQSKAVDVAQALVDKLQPVKSNSDAIQAYLAQQRENLAKRHAENQTVKGIAAELGTSVRALGKLFGSKRSPLDQAMARKNNRGTARPGAK